MILKENTDISLNGEEVGCANFGLRDYSPADGVEREGLTALLFLSSTDSRIVVGEGSIFEAGWKTWKVLSVSDAERRGKVEVEAVESTSG
jgi:hypothetical protein